MFQIRQLFVVCLFLIAGLIFSYFFQSASTFGIINQAVIYAVFALGVGFLLRQNGLVSFGHALFYGGAGYALGVLINQQVLTAEVSLLLVFLGIAAFALVLGLIIVRVPGISFGMLTLALGQMAYLFVARSRGVLGGMDGVLINWPETLFGVSLFALLEPRFFFIFCWFILVGVAYALWLFTQSRYGLITEAIRDNEERARFIGIKTTFPRALVYMISALVAAVAGFLSSLNTGFISPESMHWSVSAVVLLMAVVGGTKFLLGPALGAVVYILFKHYLGDVATYSLAIFGFFLIVVIVFSPDGLMGMLQRLVRRQHSCYRALKER